ncbi:elongation factor 1-alpha-like [Mya arenaria]|uniref:elongation factor 1-alpha-like n=1 Tax=Mya arenaria TaxID=6604 RepID=UPI0022E0E2E1|nr:elongation factor 1-alpha-like [Mya arenaria]XP_052785283.1 elongation factor 1-alpha-like [Mya arenaria]
MEEPDQETIVPRNEGQATDGADPNDHGAGIDDEEIDFHDAELDPALNTVTFGGVEKFSAPNSTVSSTPGGDGGMSPTGVRATNEMIANNQSPGTFSSIPATPQERSDSMNINPENVVGRETIPKPYINAVILGHQGSGKSTVAGRLVYECDGIDEELMSKFEKDANEAGRPSYKYAWIMDKLMAERERGISIDTKLRRIESRNYYVNVIDAPGHTDYCHNLITGTSQADVAILVVSARWPEYEEGVSRSGQTREHAMLAYAMGVKQLIVVVNKMDVTKPKYSEKRYKFVVENVDRLVKKAGFEPETVIYLPVSGWMGDNLVKRSENLAWFKQWQIERKSGGASGRSLLDALDAMERPARMDRYPLRIAVHSVYKLGTSGIVVAGKIHCGFVKPGMSITLGPPDIKAKVKAVQLHHDAVTEAYQGENVGLQIEGLDVKDVRKGYVVGESSRDPPKMTTLFTAQILILNHKGAIKKGFTPMLHCHTGCVPVRFAELRERCDRKSGAKEEYAPTELFTGDACVVDLAPVKPLCIESFFDYPTLGRFVIRDTHHTIGVGVCVNIPGREPPQTDDDKWAVGTVPFVRRPQTTGGRSVSFSIPQPDEFDKPSKRFSLVDEATFRTQSGRLETEL